MRMMKWKGTFCFQVADEGRGRFALCTARQRLHS